MLKNYLSTALNNLRKNKLFSAINILGLAIGLAACVLIGLYVQEETSYDKHWDNAGRIYRVNTTIDRTGGNPDKMAPASELLLPALREYFPEDIQAGTRIQPLGREIYVGRELYEFTVSEVDSGFAEIFDLDVLAGSLEDALAGPGSIALSAETARRLFSREDVVGEVLSMAAMGPGGERRELRVSAVYRLPEGNTVLATALAAMVRDYASNCGNVWLSNCAETYIRLAPGVEAGRIRAGLPAFTDANIDISALGAGPGVAPSDRVSLELQNIRDIYLNSPFENDTGNKTMVVAFSAIAVLVLMIGCINFTLLSTAKAAYRAREVALRKTVGAGRRQLVRQFLGESVFIVLPAIGLSLMLVELMLPFFESIVGVGMAVEYDNPGTWTALATLLAVVSFTGGFYPALVLSRFRPSATLRPNRSTETRGSISLRNTLVVFQFAVSIALMAATAVIYAQVQYSTSRDPGFDTDNLLFLEGLVSASPAEQNALKQQVAALAGVEHASLSGYHYLQRNGTTFISRTVHLQGGSGEPHQFNTVIVDHDFFDTYGIPLLAGRDFEGGRDRPSPVYVGSYQEATSRSSAVINASALRRLGFSDPAEAVGRQIEVRGFNDATHIFTVIGVVADTQFYSARNVPRPEIYLISQQQGYLNGALTIRYRGPVEALLPRIHEVWNSVMGDAAISVGFVEQIMAREFRQERIEARMLVSFSLLAMVIACLGLFGSATFNVERRTKEIGIRKVMGAEIRDIVCLLLWQFSRPVMFANAIAWPIAIWSMTHWLQRFAYQIDTWVLFGLCAGAGMVALLIAWLTVAGNTVRVATASPVYSLRYE